MPQVKANGLTFEYESFGRVADPTILLIMGFSAQMTMWPLAMCEGLAAKGHQLDIRNVKGVGSVKSIMIDPHTGVLMGGVSPTGDSYVMAW